MDLLSERIGEVEYLHLLRPVDSHDDVAVRLIDAANDLASAVLAEPVTKHGARLDPCDAPTILCRQFVRQADLHAALAERANEGDSSVVDLAAMMLLGEELVRLGDEVVEQLVLADFVLLALADTADLFFHRNPEAPLEHHVVEGSRDGDCFVFAHAYGGCVVVVDEG